MGGFVQKFAGKVTAILECFDRVIFEGHLRAISYAEGMEKLMAKNGLLIKDFKRFVQSHSDQLVQHAKDTAAAAGRPYEYLRRHIRKDEKAQSIAERDGINKGLVCVFSELEMCPTFKIAYGKDRPHIRFTRRKCLCLYYYVLHPELGLIHVRLQSWFPFVIQISVNGHAESRRLAGRVRRKLKRLHARGLLARIPHSTRWRVTINGHAFMTMAIKHHDEI